MRAMICCLAFWALAMAPANAQTDADKDAILATLSSWNEGWAQADASLAVQDYAEDVDWTNAFGDRFQGRDDLRQGLEFIFSLGFVMAGHTGGNEYADITFLSPDIALLRSKLVRKG
ncbi:MAG: YybH family protein, partial [Hyphococcus sp.]